MSRRGRSASYIWPSTRNRTIENLRLGFDVNIARALANRLHEQVVHQVDDRAAVDHRLDVGEIDLGGVGLQLHGRLVQVGRHGVDFETFFVAARQRPLDAAAEREDGPDT